MMELTVKITPTGSKLFTGPINLSLKGPFQSNGTGQLPDSDLTLAISTSDLTGSLEIISTGGHGYVTVSGQSYKLPQSTFQSLESGFAAATGPVGGSTTSVSTSGSTTGVSTAGSGTGVSTTGSAAGATTSGSSAVAGLDPLHWLSGAKIVGHGSIGGVQTTEVRAQVDVPAMLTNISSLIGGAGSGASALLTPTAQAQLAKEIGTPTLDVWTGNSDRTLRQLAVSFKVPVTGSTSTTLGGMRSAAFSVQLRYTELNRSQQIVAPQNLKPYHDFTSKLASILAGLSAASASASGN